MSKSTNQEKEIFNEALKIPSIEARLAYLRGACGHDTDLRARLEALLSAYDSAEGFIPDKSEAGTSAGDEPISEGAGSVIGRYKLLQRLGEGGMGVVYMAEQTDPVIRKVALKIIKLGMDTKSVVARFEAERQALAMMDHPNIAKVLDAGATDSGRPYFVMELVRGIPLTEYCDKSKLSTRQRLELFIPVCQAIQHAHHKGVIHRDIKPSNVMVTLNDGVPHPMVIDFGIAKAVNQKLTEKTLFTSYAHMIGTPAYMSPEQAEMSKLDVDTRADVYSMGVLLYELLTGTTPFPAKELLSRGYAEMQRIISEQEPPRPSTRMSTMHNQERTVVAKNRNMEVSALGRLFRGDLDWIVMKALEKDRTQRYETVNGLAADIRRHLDNEPVSAAAPTFSYQLRKFARRNRKYARLGAAVAALLVFAASIATWQAVRATNARKLAQAARDQEAALRREAQNEQRRAEAAQVEASAQRNRAMENEARAQTLLRLADLREAQESLDVHDLALASKLVERHRPPNGELAETDWEWRHLWLKCLGDNSETLTDLDSAIHSLSISRDGNWLAIGRSDYFATNLLEVWNLKTGRRLTNAPMVENGRVRTAYSPTEDLLAFNSQRRAGRFGDDIHIWNPAKAGVVARFSLKGRCEGLGFSGDGRVLFVADNAEGIEIAGDGQTPFVAGKAKETDSQITRWDVVGRKLLPPFPAPGLGGNLGTWESFRIDADGRWGAYATADPSGGASGLDWVTVVDLRDGGGVWSKEVAGDQMTSLGLSPDGSLLVTAGEGGVEAPKLFDVETGEQLATLEGHTDLVKDVAFLPDGTRLLTASDDQTICLWDVTDSRRPRLVNRLRGHTECVWQIVLSPDRTTLVSGDQGGSVLLWDLEAKSLAPAEIALPVSTPHWQFASDNRSLLVVTDGELVRFHGERFSERTAVMPVAPNFQWSVFSRNGRYLGYGTADGHVALCDVARGEEVYRRKLLNGGAFVIMTGDDGRVVVANYPSGAPAYKVEQWDLSKREPVYSVELPHSAFPFSAESADGRWSLRNNPGAKRGALLEDQLDRGSGILLGDFRSPTFARFSPNGDLFGLVTMGQSVAVYDTATGTRRTVFSVHVPRSNMITLAFSPDNKRLATGGVDRHGLRFWDIETGRPTISFKVDRWELLTASFSPDGKWFGASTSKGLRLWYAPSPDEIEALSARRSLATPRPDRW